MHRLLLTQEDNCAYSGWMCLPSDFCSAAHIDFFIHPFPLLFPSLKSPLQSITP